ncbi:Na+/H+ antiporter NhaC family protein [Bacilliculturomica massiliensis]|uniref:hypothetical protein n=1 Tax=Bacilliculturomica massiliensis TaxID=1917867 RepID=UPI001030E9F5|nr:hypothetical protein [Bacilliculturomica massiliensis]
MELGILTLLPMVVLFVLIFTTKRMLLSVTAATMTGSVLLGGFGFMNIWLEKVQGAFMGGTVGYCYLLLALFGMLISLLDASGAVTEFAMWLSKFANTKRKALFITYILGWLIFVDDYLNNMAIATAMKKVCDSHRIPRTFLGYIINSTAAPVCIIVPISTWAVFYSGLYEDFGVTVNGSGTAAYFASVPYMFFAWIALIVMVLVILGVIPEIGITRKHAQLAKETGIVCTAEVSLDGKEIVAPDFEAIMKENTGLKAQPWNFLLPLAVLIVITLTSDVNVMLGCGAAIAVTAVLMLIQKKSTITGILDSAYQGVLSMVSICIIIAMTMTLVEVNTATGMADFVVNALAPYLNGAFLPALVFGFCAVYSYFGGGFWDMAMIFMGIVVPLANGLGVDPILPCAALVCASAAGSTTYVCGDAIMVSSRAMDIKPYYQMMGTLPYAVISYVLSVVAFLIVGLI